MDNHKTSKKRWYWLLIVPWILSLWIPSYNHLEPRLFGFPFFYWYQMFLVIVAAIVIGIVYYKAHAQDDKKNNDHPAEKK
jgi:putative solute:sodium symporter small subunit